MPNPNKDRKKAPGCGSIAVDDEPGVPTITHHLECCALRYTYDPRRPVSATFDVEVYRTTRKGFLLYVDGEYAGRLRMHERRIQGTIQCHFKPESVDRHYYKTLQECAEGAIQKMRRDGELPSSA